MQIPSTKPSKIPDAWAVARALARSGHKVDLNGVVTNTSGSPTLVLTLSLASLTILSGLVWPMVCAIGTLALIASAMSDMDGGKGWVRRLLVKDISHTVIVWPHHHRPGVIPPSKPTLLITAPLEPNVANRRISNRILWFPFIVIIAGCIGAISQPWVGPDLATGCATAILAMAALAWGISWVGSRQAKGNPARDSWHQAFMQLQDLQHLQVVWALVGGGSIHNDGLETLLRNHPDRLDPTNTRVLCLQPSTLELAAVQRDGRIRGRPADPCLMAIAHSTGLSLLDHLTGASRAQRCGWRAMGITVPKKRTDQAAQKLSEIIARADRMAGARQW